MVFNCSPEERFEFYDQTHCWQYDIRLNNLKEDIQLSGYAEDYLKTLKISDFAFEAFVTERDKEKKKEHQKTFNAVKQFIERHEWLGSMSLHPTHFFTARYNGILAGVIVMDMPNTFTKLLGETTRKMERLVSRGACISWSPKGLASSLLMWSIKWMAQNTRYRIFTAYSDPEALELGTIYQACNFFYLGQTAGASKRFKLPSGKWTSDRYFRSRSVYKRIAKELNINWQPEWQQNDNIIWNNIPTDIAKQLKQTSKEMMLKCESRIIPPKHKYCYIIGKTKKETKELIQIFVHKNPHLFESVPDKSLMDNNRYVNADNLNSTTPAWRKRIPYPKNRGDHN